MAEVKRAGDVKGTPDWQLDRMIEMDMAMTWEQRNRDVNEERTLREALPDLEVAVETLRGAIHSLSCAYMFLKDVPTGDKLVSVMDALEDTLCDLKVLRDICEGSEKR